MKNATNHTTVLTGPYSLVTDRSQVVLSPYPADDQRVRLRRIGPDPVRHITSDTTTHRAIEQDRASLADRFVRNCTDILCTLNAEGRFINVSVASQLILGYEPEEMEGRLMSDFMSHEDFEKSMQAGREALSGQSFTNFENTCTAKDGSAVPMAWSVRWSAEDRLIYCVGRDDSEKKAVERELCKLNESLEVKIRERTAQLEQSVKELEAFSYSVSHDLRAPLRIINGYARLLTDQYKKNADPEAREFLDAIIESTQYMGRLIDDLLNLSRIDRESMHKTEVNMDFLTRLIVDKMQEEDPSVTKDITVHELKPAICDQALIRQVWVNLLSNAVKYSRKKANPKIEVGSYDTDTSVVYYVKDNGAGFDMKFAAKLFGVFVRLHNRNEFEGTGVGLALVHRIIMKHGGKVWVNGKVDEGAVFYFSLPKP